MKKYSSEILEAIHGDFIGLFELGMISEAELREFEEDAFIDEDGTDSLAANEVDAPKGMDLTSKAKTEAEGLGRELVGVHGDIVMHRV